MTLVQEYATHARQTLRQHELRQRRVLGLEKFANVARAHAVPPRERRRGQVATGQIAHDVGLDRPHPSSANAAPGTLPGTFMSSST